MLTESANVTIYPAAANAAQPAPLAKPIAKQQTMTPEEWLSKYEASKQSLTPVDLPISAEALRRVNLYGDEDEEG